MSQSYPELIDDLNAAIGKLREGAPDPMRGLAIYPNPSTGIFTVEVGNALITAITVYTADMCIVSASNPRTIRPMIALEELPNGLYSMKVTSGGNIAWRTIIVAH